MAVAEPAVVPCRLYLITPERFDADSFAPLLEAALDAGDIACVQLRLKNVEDDVIRRTAARLLPITTARNVALLLNDRPDLARETGCDGVHIGQTDGTYEEARRLLGPDRIVGVTCHADRDLAMDAAEAGADYVAFGAFFPSTTKEVTHHADIDLLEWWSEIMTVPCVAIGGITPDNCPPLVAAGADFLAVSASVWNHAEGPAAAIRAFAKMMDRARIT